MHEHSHSQKLNSRQLRFIFVPAGSVWVNMYNVLDSRMPFGGYKV